MPAVYVCRRVPSEFTPSGSGTPRAVSIDHRNLLNNQGEPGDEQSSPDEHDPKAFGGLIGRRGKWRQPDLRGFDAKVRRTGPDLLPRSEVLSSAHHLSGDAPASTVGEIERRHPP